MPEGFENLSIVEIKARIYDEQQKGMKIQQNINFLENLLLEKQTEMKKK